MAYSKAKLKSSGDKASDLNSLRIVCLEVQFALDCQI
jgi:hypothetical protein